MRTILLCASLGAPFLFACSVPPTRRSHTEYAERVSYKLGEVDWELVSAQCGAGRPLGAALLAMHVHFEQGPSDLRVRSKRVARGCADEFTARLVPLCSSRETCAQDQYRVAEVVMISRSEGCDQSRDAPTVVRLTHDGPTLRWTTNLEGLCGGVPAVLSFEPAPN